MVKQELIKTLEEIRIAQSRLDKFRNFYTEFCSEPRCKKGCLEFLRSLDGSGDNQEKPVIFRNELREIGISFTAAKSELNTRKLGYMLSKCLLETGNANVLKEKRKELLKQLGEYIINVSEQLAASPLLDAKERQLYLRRAIARLVAMFQCNLILPIQKDQWCNVEPNDYFDYLNRSLAELIADFDYSDHPAYQSVHYDWWNLDKPNTLDSVETFLDYLDSFLVY